MTNYTILIDGAADMPGEIRDKYSIDVVPMSYYLNERNVTISEETTEEEKEALTKELKDADVFHTSQIPPGEYELFFEKYLKEGQSILYLSLSSGMSSTILSAQTAKDTLSKKYPEQKIMILDTHYATAGIGMMAELAGINRDKGMSLEDNFSDIVRLVPHFRSFFLVEDLDHLKKGGRISSALSIMGAALGIRPVMYVDPTGHIQLYSKTRSGKIAAKNMAQYLLLHIDRKETELVYISHANNIELATEIRDLIIATIPELEIRITSMSPCIAVHTGPESVALFTIAKTHVH